MIRRFFYGPFLGGRAASGLLALRVIAGLGLIAHGYPKIQKPFSWMGPDAPVPGFLQFLGAFSEFFGGLALIGGLLTPLAALGIIATMLFAAFLAHGNDPFVASGPGPSKEPALSYFLVALTLFLTGPGTFSLDNILFGKKRTAVSPNDQAAVVR
ncbi:MAG: DoxX family protein [Akkermansiaceae bacterium]|nr:DoxX family protein [Armatimonadota bacterium]